MPATLRIALTGGIGSGKSTVAALFAKRGAPVIDADKIARELAAPGRPALQKIIEAFGQHIIQANGALDRKKLREIVFADQIAKARLEAILHPLIYAEIDRRIDRVEYPYCLAVIPLLLETGRPARFDRVLLIDVPERLQLERALQRDRSAPALIKKMIASQITRADRLQYGDDVIDNTGAIDALDGQAQRLHARYLQMAKDTKPQRLSQRERRTHI